MTSERSQPVTIEAIVGQVDAQVPLGQATGTTSEAEPDA